MTDQAPPQPGAAEPTASTPADPPAAEPAETAPAEPESPAQAAATDDELAAPARRSGQHWIPAFVLAVLAVLALGWIGAEQHYQSCIQAANARTSGVDALSRLVRSNAVKNCHRLPF